MKECASYHLKVLRACVSIPLGALLSASLAASADFHCADLKPSDRQPSYQRVPGQMRCEGFYAQNVSQPFIELVSLTGSAPPMQSGGVLQMSGSGLAPIQLVVHPLRPGPFYRMDARIEAASSLQWNATPMLDATGLQLRDLGFLAIVARDDGMLTVVPVAFSNSSSTPANVVQGILRVSVPVNTVAWRRLRLDGIDDGTGAWREIPGPARFAWERIPFTLDLPTDGRGVRVEVEATDPDGNLLPSLHFNVRSAADATR